MLSSHACHLTWHRDRLGRSLATITGTAVPLYPWMAPTSCADPDDEHRPATAGRPRLDLPPNP